ncbi:MAG TPA: hypothetical protein VEQ65_05565 [Opitutus sp.]|nr:hypothetical protein [Opitutus sp.]
MLVRIGFAALLLGGTRATAALENVPARAADALAAPRAALASFIDNLPDLPDLGLPSFQPSGAVRLSLRPRFGDLLHEDYFRLLIGARVKVSDEIEFNAELGSYVTHGLDDYVGHGLYQFRYGLKIEKTISDEAGWSYGFDWVTPLSHPPIEITDGVRHTLPFVTYTRTLVPRYGLVGFATLGADLIDHTSLPENYRENQLRANNLILTLGLAREWRRLNFILRVFDANTAPLSGESENVFGIRPGVGVPLLRRPDGTARATATFEGRAIWGPDGFETGVTTSVRVDLRYRRNRPVR